MPGEFSPELVIGVPTDFDTPEGIAKYFLRPDVHLTGPDFVLPGAPGVHRTRSHTWTWPRRLTCGCVE